MLKLISLIYSSQLSVIDFSLLDTVHAEFEHLLMKIMLCWQ